MREMKDSGIQWIGRMPEHWNVYPIKSIILQNDGGIWGEDPDDNVNNTIVLRSTEQTVDGKWNIIEPAQRDLTSISNADYYRCIEGDLLITKSSGSDLHIGKTTIVDENVEKMKCCYSNFIQRIRVDRSYEPRLIWYLFNSSIVREQFVYMQNSTSGIGNLNAKYIAELRVPLPSKKEQNCIINYLDKKCAQIDAIIEKQQEIIEKLKEYKLSVISEAVTKGLNLDVEMKDSGSIWFGKIPETWSMKRLKFVFHIQKDIAGEEGHTVLSITQRGIVPKDFSNNEGQFAKSYANYQLVHKGDFAMNHMDLLTGWVDISNYEGVTSPDYRVFVLDDKDNCYPEYYLYMMQMCYNQKVFYGLGAGVSGFGRWRLQADKFLNFWIPIPPLEEQKAIAKYINTEIKKIDTFVKKREKIVEKLTLYKKSLIYEVVTGKREV